jgi:dihydroorotate dehydrogenase (NAD+) catalytic subunit
MKGLRTGAVRRERISLGLKVPVIIGSGIIGFGEEYDEVIDYSAYGAIVTKTITLEPRAGNPAPRIAEVKNIHSVINSIGLENPGLKVFLSEKVKSLERLSAKTKVIVSVAGESKEEFFTLVKEVSGLKFISGIELNLSCPNIRGKRNIFNLVDKKLLSDTLRSIRGATALPIIPKLPPVGVDLIELAKVCKDCSADAIVVANTFPAMVVSADIKEMELVLKRKQELCNKRLRFGGLSGLAVKPVILRYVYEIRRNVEIPIIASGGIVSVRDALEYFIAGASAIEIGSGLFCNPKIGEEIAEYVKKKRIRCSMPL